MAKQIPQSHLDLFQKKAFAHLATVMNDGSPHVTPVWVDYDGNYVLVNSAEGRQKDVNMEERPEVALDILDPENPYRYLAIRGQVVEITDKGANDHIDRLSKKYTGRDKYAGHRPGETRRIYKIAPSWVQASG
jgi:PPOX class probable F420-dependent enzyme